MRALTRAGLVWACLLFFLPLGTRGQVFDNQCPVGQSSMVPMRTVNITTGHFNDTVCADIFGNLSFLTLGPSLTASDNFVRANGSLGSNWKTNFGAPLISSNSVVGGASGNVAIWADPSFVSNSQFAQATVVSILNGDSGPEVFASSVGASGYACTEMTTTIFIRKITAGVPSTLTSSAITGANGDIIRLEITSAGVMTCYRNGVSTLTVTDTSYKSGSPGIFLLGSGTVTSLNNWSGGNLPVSVGTGPKYPVSNGITYVDGSFFPCTAAGIASAISATSVGGNVHAEGCTAAFTWSSIVTISQPLTLWLPCANVIFTSQLLNVRADDVHIHGCGAGGSGAISIYNNSTAGSVYTASGLGSTINAIVAYKGPQTTLQAQRQSAFTLDNLILNMNSVGNRAVSTSSCWSCKLDQVIVQNAACSDGAIFQEASNPGGLLLTESYFMHMDNVLVTIAQANTTCHPFYFDSSRGEIAYGIYNNLTGIGYPQAGGSGSDSVYVDTGATSTSQSFDQNVFLNLKTQDPTTGAYGIKLQARGNFGGTVGSSFLRTNGAIFNVQFIDAQPERIFSTGGSGTAIGCVNAAGSADGTGCAFIANSNFSSGGWAQNEDSLNMGAGYMSVSTNSAVLQGPIFRQTGLHNGSNSVFERIDPNYQPTGNTQNGYSVQIVPSTINPNNFTADVLYGMLIDLSSGTHTGGAFGTAYGLFCNGFGSWVTAEWCIYGVGAAGNHMDSWLEIGGASVANPGCAANSGRFWYDQANQRYSICENSGTFTAVMNSYSAAGAKQTGLTHVVQDTATLATGTVTVTFTGAAVFTNATSYTCIADDDTAIAATRVLQNSGSSITITGTGTDVIRYICVGN